MYKKISKFVLLTYLISWTMWSLLALLTHYTSMKFSQPICMILFTLGGLGPTFAPFLLADPRTDRDGFKKFIGQILKARVNPLWYLYIIAIPLVLFLIPYLINYSYFSTRIQFIRKPLYMLLVFIPTNILFGGLEELGWRGTLLPEFMKKYSLFMSTLITSIIWIIWHLPLWFVKGSSQEGSSFFVFLIIGFCFSFILSALYNRTKSIFLCVICHSIINSYSSIFNILIKNIYLDLLIMLAFSVVLFLFLSKDKEKNLKENIETID